MKRTFAMFCIAALLLLTGCADAPQRPDQSQPTASKPPSSVWIDSEDGVLSLRLGAPDATLDCEAAITAVVELRNNSDEPVNVLRPFGDLNAVYSWFELTGPKGAMRFTGSVPSYPLGKNSFAELDPGESIYDWHDLMVDDFEGSDLSGQYTIRYTYAVSKGHRESAERLELENFWTGEITSRVVTVTKRESLTASKPEQIEDVVSIQFPRDEYVFTLAEAAEGVRFEYRIVVRRDLDGIIPQPQDTGNAGGPGPSGLYPFEEISGEGQSYSLRDVGLGFPIFDVIHVEKGTDVLSFEWDGKNWGGPSDTDAPKGPPFPPGVYYLKLSVKGYERTPDGDEPYEISRSATVRLVP